MGFKAITERVFVFLPRKNGSSYFLLTSNNFLGFLHVVETNKNKQKISELVASEFTMYFSPQNLMS